jgi:hypothetical protein
MLVTLATAQNPFKNPHFGYTQGGVLFEMVRKENTIDFVSKSYGRTSNFVGHYLHVFKTFRTMVIYHNLGI